MSRTRPITINGDKSMGYLDEFIGHVFYGYRPFQDLTPTETDKEAYVLEFSTDKAEEYFEQELLTIEEQQLVLKAARQRAMSGNLLGYDELHRLLCQNRFDGGEDE